MRQRKARDLQQRLQGCSEYMELAPTPQAWEETFGSGNDLYLEIGCGKGNFIIKKAEENPQNCYIAVEGQETVILRGLEKLRQRDEAGQGIGNLRFVLAFINHMGDFFYENRLSGIYLNFSDPWPKSRHKKRRLTHRDRLTAYKKALKPGGFIEIKTDNDDLYDFTLEEIHALGYEIAEQTRDLHASQFTSKDTMTEYEEKFKSSGKNINYVKLVF
ncbi:MAG: tRNA (guanosine(46)-N7)-methyltransferase TrmB [Clostridiales bacterium]|nr:tRNA (guanosine(46)-N7)-methyltransferase TrmB [Clostridiales bacterium]